MPREAAPIWGTNRAGPGSPAISETALINSVNLDIDYSQYYLLSSAFAMDYQTRDTGVLWFEWKSSDVSLYKDQKRATFNQTYYARGARSALETCGTRPHVRGRPRSGIIGSAPWLVPPMKKSPPESVGNERRTRGRWRISGCGGRACTHRPLRLRSGRLTAPSPRSDCRRQ